MLNGQALRLAGERGMKSNLVEYVCRAKVHVAASGPAVSASPVTIHEGAWAYCPAGAREAHQWEAIEPVSLTYLKVIGFARAREAAPEDSRI
jgi:hypothetical protein